MFQFTRPQGARHVIPDDVLSNISFNSRAHKGRDGLFEKPHLVSVCFNSRAHKGRDWRGAL